MRLQGRGGFGVFGYNLGVQNQQRKSSVAALLIGMVKNVSFFT